MWNVAYHVMTSSAAHANAAAKAILARSGMGLRVTHARRRSYCVGLPSVAPRVILISGLTPVRRRCS